MFRPPLQGIVDLKNRNEKRIIMSRLNKNAKTPAVYTHNGAVASKTDALEQLRRAVMTCLLWEDSFYEDGASVADRIATLIPKVEAEEVAAIAIEARNDMKLRHVPLLIVREMARLETHKYLVAETLEQVIQRPDELTEFLAIYWKDDADQPLSNQVKRGLAAAFLKFNEYQLAKYDSRKDKIKLRDVLFLVHPTPKGTAQAGIWKRLAEKNLATPKTWETEISEKGNNPETWQELIKEKALGGLAFLRNLRNMEEAKVKETAIKKGFETVDFSRVLPFRFIAAAKHASRWEPFIETAMLEALKSEQKLPGKTVLLVDVSGSMEGSVSNKSDLTRVDAAAGLAILLREICEDVVVYSFADNAMRIPARHGFALAEAIRTSQGGGTNLGNSLRTVNKAETYDRLIVITDEQSSDAVSGPSKTGYIINVAPYQNGVAYGKFVHISGWSEAVVTFIQRLENNLTLKRRVFKSQRVSLPVPKLVKAKKKNKSR